MRRRLSVPPGSVLQVYRYALDPTPAQERALLSHAGAARFAFNHMLALVKQVLDQRAAERSYGVPEDDLTPVVDWSLPGLRRAWNARKNLVAPWWSDNSKEAYNTGLESLSISIRRWAGTRSGGPTAARHGFPRFKTKARTTPSIRFTTGAIGVTPDRHHVELPRIWPNPQP